MPSAISLRASIEICLYRLTLGAEHDLALAVALDKNRLLDADGAVAKFLPRCSEVAQRLIEA